MLCRTQLRLCHRDSVLTPRQSSSLTLSLSHSLTLSLSHSLRPSVPLTIYLSLSLLALFLQDGLIQTCIIHPCVLSVIAESSRAMNAGGGGGKAKLQLISRGLTLATMGYVDWMSQDIQTKKRSVVGPFCTRWECLGPFCAQLQVTGSWDWYNTWVPCAHWWHGFGLNSVTEWRAQSRRRVCRVLNRLYQSGWFRCKAEAVNRCLEGHFRVFILNICFFFSGRFGVLQRGFTKLSWLP